MMQFIYLAMTVMFSLSEQTFPLPSDVRKSAGFSLNSPLIHHMRGEHSKVSIYGYINASTAKELERIIGSDPRVNEILIDTPGGEIASSIKIANLLKKHNLTLTVDGRCLSSCANFLFMAAPKKRVLKNSLIGIHEFSFPLETGRGTRWVTGNEAQKELGSVSNQGSLSENNALRKTIEQFYVENNVNQSLFRAFNTYISNRKKSFLNEDIKSENSTKTCPSFDFWILHKKQLEEIGATGIEEFWYPKNSDEMKLAAIDNGFKNSDSLYIGNASGLSKVCTSDERTPLRRLRDFILGGSR
ncbi:hypothetical protein RF679_13760 [Undibacterium cyanobacteriorum]|uniref:Clp protease n=1 Tax=Undibacterium cyanobacteriorum TaxID=3073561 RepID=A0ABY9RER6_9BURK|nr:hypothetical protein [Undibacterium sp. 20NA77.5]WMW79712.1 hypothetical protein RF679_13760 [Undibacterium sp. 20NA77.5]